MQLDSTRGLDTWQSHFAPARIALQTGVNTGIRWAGDAVQQRLVGLPTLPLIHCIEGMRYCTVSWHRPAARAVSNSLRCKSGMDGALQTLHLDPLLGQGRGLKIGRAAHHQPKQRRILWPAFWPQGRIGSGFHVDLLESQRRHEPHSDVQRPSFPQRPAQADIGIHITCVRCTSGKPTKCTVRRDEWNTSLLKFHIPSPFLGKPGSCIPYPILLLPPVRDTLPSFGKCLLPLPLHIPDLNKETHAILRHPSPLIPIPLTGTRHRQGHRGSPCSRPRPARSCPPTCPHPVCPVSYAELYA